MEVLHEDILLLIVDYLQHKGLYKSVAVLLEESDIDTTWLCGPSAFVSQLRRCILGGDYELAVELLEPLLDLDQPAYRSMVSELLMHAYCAACVAMETPQARIKWWQRLKKVAPAAATDLKHLVYVVDVQATFRETFGSWNVHFERMRCYQQLVASLRDVPDNMQRYTTIPRLHLQTLLGQAMSYQELQRHNQDIMHEYTSDGATTTSLGQETRTLWWDCLSSEWTCRQHPPNTSALYLNLPRAPSDPNVTDKNHPVHTTLASTRRSYPSSHHAPEEWPTYVCPPVDVVPPTISISLEDSSSQTDDEPIGGIKVDRSSQTKLIDKPCATMTTQTNAPPQLHHQLVQACIVGQDCPTQTDEALARARTHSISIQTTAVTSQSWATQTTMDGKPTSTPLVVVHAECQTTSDGSTMQPPGTFSPLRRSITHFSIERNNQLIHDGSPPLNYHSHPRALRHERSEDSSSLDPREPQDEVYDDEIDLDQSNYRASAASSPHKSDLHHVIPVATVVPATETTRGGLSRLPNPVQPLLSSRNDMIRLSVGLGPVDTSLFHNVQLSPQTNAITLSQPLLFAPPIEPRDQQRITPPVSRPHARFSSTTPNAWTEPQTVSHTNQQHVLQPLLQQQQQQQQPQAPLTLGTVLKFTRQENAERYHATVVAETREAQAIRAMAISHSGKYVAMGTNARVLRVLNIHDAVSKSNGQPLATRHLLPVVSEHYKHHSGPIYSVAWHPRDGLVATGSSDASIHIVKPFALDAPPLVLAGHRGKVRAVQFCPQNGNILGSVGSGDTLVRLWDVQTASDTPLMQLHGHMGELTSLAFLRLGDRCITGSQDCTVRLWDLRTGSCQSMFQASAPVQAVACHPLQSDWKIAAGLSDGSCLVWDRRQSAMPVATLRHHSNECRVVTWSPADGNLLLTASFDGTTCVLDDNGNVRGTFRENTEMILQGCWHPSIPAFATSSGDKMLKLWKFTV